MGDVWQNTDDHRVGGWQTTDDHLAPVTANNAAILARMQLEQNQPTGAPERFAKGFGGTVAGVVDSSQFVHPDEMVAAATSLKDGDYLGALHHALRAGPAKQVEDAIRSHVEQGAKAIADYKAGRNSEAVGHAVAAVIPVAGPMAANLADQATGEPAMPPGQQVEEPHPPDVAGASGSATAIGAMGLVPKAGGLASKATPSGLVRAAEVIRHPVRTAVAAGLDMAAEAMKRKNAAVVNPPVLPVQPAAVVTPPALPPPALPPQAPAMAPNGLPIRPPLRSAPAVESHPDAVQPPIEPFDAAGNQSANVAADAASGVKSKSGLIAMLERRKILTIGDRALLAKLKAEVAAEQPVEVPTAQLSAAEMQPNPEPEQPNSNVVNLPSPDVPRGTSMPPVGDLRGDQAYLNTSDETGLSAKSPQEIGNRTAKAQRFINKLGGTQNLPRTQAEWTTLADSMGEKTPSPETQDLITKGLNTRMVKGVEKPGTPAQSLEDQLQDSIRLARLKKSFPFETQEQLMERLKK